MANEIVTLEFNARRDGSIWSGAFLYPLDPPILDHNGIPLPVTPSAALPLHVLQLNVFTQTEIDEFNAGTRMYFLTPVELFGEDDSSNAARAAKLQAEYVRLDPVEATREKWQFFGVRISAL